MRGRTDSLSWSGTSPNTDTDHRCPPTSPASPSQTHPLDISGLRVEIALAVVQRRRLRVVEVDAPPQVERVGLTTLRLQVRPGMDRDRRARVLQEAETV